ncbi:hypothetical protein pipiens_018042 [Culex pipiens pipiens]|uniref:Uncharacterized protein n=1 Tax=Culex pipiens pipiens TaxID=38569 RepID=A0ABD1CDV6_CULPP
MDGVRALDILPLLQERFALLSGGRDNRGGPIICFPATTKRERVKPEDIKRVVSYLIGIPRPLNECEWSQEGKVRWIVCHIRLDGLETENE